MSTWAQSKYTDRLELAIAIVRETGAHTMRLFQSDKLSIERKGDSTPVTNADRGAEELMRQRLEAECPGDAIVGEEFEDKPGTSGYAWYLDPIDGTQSFIRGVPLFGTMAGLEHDGNPVAGIIFMPALGEIIYAAEGSGAWWATGLSSNSTLEPRRAFVSKVRHLEEATVSATSTQYSNSSVVEQVALKAGLARGWGDCYGHYLVATGRIEAMLDPEMSVWDCAPLLPIITEAGGRFTTTEGITTIHGGSAISTNGLVHDEVLGLIQA